MKYKKKTLTLLLSIFIPTYLPLPPPLWFFGSRDSILRARAQLHDWLSSRMQPIRLQFVESEFLNRVCRVSCRRATCVLFTVYDIIHRYSGAKTAFYIWKKCCATSFLNKYTCCCCWLMEELKFWRRTFLQNRERCRAQQPTNGLASLRSELSSFWTCVCVCVCGGEDARTINICAPATQTQAASTVVSL